MKCRLVAAHKIKMNPFSLIVHIWQTNCKTGVQPWDYSLLLLISIDSNPSVPSSSDVAHTCFCTLVHGSLWLVSTNHSNALRLQKCVYGEHISFELISESPKYFRLQECQWFPAIRFLQISIKLLKERSPFYN